MDSKSSVSMYHYPMPKPSSQSWSDFESPDQSKSQSTWVFSRLSA
jgi:hypothetical protein